MRHNYNLGFITDEDIDSHDMNITKLHGIFEGMACDKPKDYHHQPPQ